MSETNPTSICAHERTEECIDCLRAELSAAEDMVTRQRERAKMAERRLADAERHLADWRAWLKAQGWDEVEDIEAELGRPSLDSAEPKKGEP